VGAVRDDDALGALTGLRWHRVRFPVERRGLDDDAVLVAVDEAMGHLAGDPRLRPGASVAVGVGSRGIDRLPLVLRAVVWRLRGLGCMPFLFPAMGSHGGGMAEGRRAVLAELGVDEDTVGAEVRCGEDVVPVGTSASGMPVSFDATAAAADAIVVVNRVKPHTHMPLPGGSGLRKMLVIGAGHQVQASRVHRMGAEPLGAAVDECLDVVLARLPVVGGVALLEDGAHRVAQVHGLRADEIAAREPALLRRAAHWSPRLPLDRLDLLVVDRIGKDVSGSGMDTNVVGRVRAVGLDRWPTPDIAVVYARALTEATHGNALGVGLADIVHRRLAEAVDREVTALNALAATSTGMAALPIVADTDRQAMEWIGSRLLPAGLDPVVVWIPDTLHLDDVVLSGAAMAALPENRLPEREALSEPLRFDDEGDLVPPAPLD
jgi:hypothetical protein